MEFKGRQPFKKNSRLLANGEQVKGGKGLRPWIPQVVDSYPPSLPELSKSPLTRGTFLFGRCRKTRHAASVLARKILIYAQ